MGKTWILHTETKGTGAQMVPLESVTKRPVTPEPVRVPRSPQRPTETEAPVPRAPRRFKVVDVMTQESLADGASLREVVRALSDVRSVVDVSVYVWQQSGRRWRLLPLADKHRLWEAAHAPRTSADS